MRSITLSLKKIEVRFGLASWPERQERIEEGAIELGLSIEKMLEKDFKNTFDGLIRQPGQTLLDSYFLLFTGKKVACPKITLGSYVQDGNHYPKIIIHSESLQNLNTQEKIFLSDALLKSVGQSIDADFGFEFVDIVRVDQ